MGYHPSLTQVISRTCRYASQDAGSAMTLSSSASQGFAPKNVDAESAMPRDERHDMSDASSIGGAGRKMTDLQRTLQGFDEPSKSSCSIDDEVNQVFSSSEEASMTREAKPVHHGRQDPESLETRTGSAASAHCSSVKAMPKMRGNAGRRNSAASSSQGQAAILLPVSSAAKRAQRRTLSNNDQPMAADE